MTDTHREARPSAGGPGGLTPDPEVPLRSVRSSDLGFLYELASHVPHLWLRTCGEGVPTVPRFEEALWAGVLQQFIVGTPNGDVAGTVGLNRASWRNGTVWIEAVPAARSRRNKGAWMTPSASLHPPRSSRTAFASSTPHMVPTAVRRSEGLHGPGGRKRGFTTISYIKACTGIWCSQAPRATTSGR